MLTSALTPYNFADGVYYRLGKKIQKRELSMILMYSKKLLTKFTEKSWKDYEIWAFVDTLIYEMKKNQFPLAFRLFYTITDSYLTNQKYNNYEEQTNSKYRSWIQEEINRLKNT